jgi:23S rRNA pseudouridine1911/1915/1917 synthase
VAAWKLYGKWLEYEVEEAAAGLTVEELLKQRLDISGRMLQRLTRKKGIFLNKKQPFLKKKVKAGDKIKVAVGDAPEPALAPTEMPLSILYEDEAVLILNKPAGLAVHPVREGQSDTLANGVSYYWETKGTPRPVRPVHRLDKDTSGAILLAGSGFIHHLLDQQLRDHTIRRTYLALVSGHPGKEGESGTFSDPIGRDPGHPVRRRVDTRGDEAVTHYTVQKLFPPIPGTAEDGAALVEVELETGRTHQIRVHFSHHGFPLLGDRLYGKREQFSAISRQALHAESLAFTHPVTGEKKVCTAPLPEDMERLISLLSHK